MSLCLIQEALVEKAKEGIGFTQLADIVNKLVKEVSLEVLADTLWAEIPKEIGFRPIVEIYNLLIFNTPTNGRSIILALESWLESGTNEEKVKLALSVNFYPFQTRQKMEVVLGKITEQYPNLSPLCQEVVNKRKG